MTDGSESQEELEREGEEVKELDPLGVKNKEDICYFLAFLG